MSRYNNFYDEQPFQQANFLVDSPLQVNSRGQETNRVELPKKAFGLESSGKKLNAYFEKEKEASPHKENKEHHLELKKAMHHEEVGLLHFDEYKIPPDWDLAENHAKSRTVQKEKDIPHADVCICCGYQIEREELPLCADNDELRFLGSGFPLFYNFLKYCMLIMLVLLLSSGVYNLYTNYYGTFCTDEGDQEEDGCKLNWMSQLSLPNKKNNSDQMEFQQYLNLLSCFLIVFLLMLFRRSQRKINAEIDEKQNSPSDYTIMVRNIPNNRNSDYKAALTDFFTNQIDPVKKYHVTKVSLLWEIDEAEEIEEEIRKKIEIKKELLAKLEYDQSAEEIVKIDQEKEKLEKDLKHKLKEIEEKPEYFAGMAFVSFQTEDEKMEVIEKSKSSDFKRLRDFLHGSRLHRQHGYYKPKKQGESAKGEGLFYTGFRLKIDEAPEPNDVNWECINSTNYEKTLMRTKSSFYTTLLLALGFGIIFVIKYYQAEYLDEAVEELSEEDEEVVAEAETKVEIVEYVNFLIAVLIIISNKTFVGPLIDRIVEAEKITTATRVNISFAHKLTLSLFFNTALITFLIEVLISQNFYKTGGLIFSELLICMVDVGTELLIWIVDPYSLFHKIKLSRQKSKGDRCTLTQKEANLISEHPNYSMSDRYADIIKTMWFVFMYSSLIPLVNVVFLIGMFLFYWIDKYNLYRRRTIKESINIQLSIEMIEMIEYIIPIYGISNFVYEYELFDTISWQALVILGVGILFAIVPMQWVNELLFHVESKNEVLTYENVEPEFDTDYDRENPVTRKQALAKWRTLRESVKRSYSNSKPY